MRSKITILLLSTFFVITLNASIEKMHKAYSKKDYDTAITYMTPLISQGNSDAMFLLAKMYFRAEGGDEDVEQGIYWLEQASKRNNIKSIMTLASIFSQDEIADWKKACLYYRQAASLKNTEGMFGTGVCYLTGEGKPDTPLDIEESLAWFIAAKKEGLEKAKSFIKDIKGELDKKSITKAENRAIEIIGKNTIKLEKKAEVITKPKSIKEKTKIINNKLNRNPHTHLLRSDSTIIYKGKLDENWVKYDYGAKGVLSKPLIWLDKFGEGFEAELVFDLNEEAKDLSIGLMSSRSHGIDTPVIFLRIQKVNDKSIKYGFSLDYKKIFEDITIESDIPKRIRMVFSTTSIQVFANGFPSKKIKWKKFLANQGLRLALYTKSKTKIKNTDIGVDKITLHRKAGVIKESKPDDGVYYLPRYVIYDSYSLDDWQKSKLGNGLISKKPQIVLDDRINTTTYNLNFKINPKTFTNLKIITTLSDKPKKNIYDNGFVELKKLASGDYSLSIHERYYDRHLKNILSRVVDKNWFENEWNGILEIIVGKHWMSTGLQNGAYIRDSNYSTNIGTKLYMTILSDKNELNIEKISSGWLTPDGMKNEERWKYLNNKNFKPEDFLSDLIEGD